MVKPVPRKSASILSGRVMGISGELPSCSCKLFIKFTRRPGHSFDLPQSVATVVFRLVQSPMSKPVQSLVSIVRLIFRLWTSDFGLDPSTLNEIQRAHRRQFPHFIFTQLRHAIVQIVNTGKAQLLASLTIACPDSSLNPLHISTQDARTSLSKVQCPKPKSVYRHGLVH